jgi:uncharacterized protein (PEP-CTERM system associated)
MRFIGHHMTDLGGNGPYIGACRSAWPGIAMAMLLLAHPAAADIEITPNATVQALATDNLRKSATDPEGDAILQSVAGIQITGETQRLRFLGTGSLLYTAFAENSSLNRLSGNMLSNAQVTVIPDFLYVDGNAQISDEFLDIADQSATGLPNGGAQNRIFNYSLGSYIKTEILDVADAMLRGQYSAVQTDPLDGTSSLVSLGDSLAFQASFLITNGERSRMAVWQLSGNLSKEERENDETFESANSQASLKLRVTPRVHVVGRVGYEQISGSTIDDINGEIWGAGLVYEIGDDSRLTVEWGRQFGRESWSGELDVKMSQSLALRGAYSERLESQQARLGRTLGDLFDQSNSLPNPQLPAPITPGQNLIDDVFYVKDATFDIVYSKLDRSLTVGGRLSQRNFTSTNGNDETAGVAAKYSEVLLRDVFLDLLGSYDGTIDTLPGQTPTDRFTGSSVLSYRLGERSTAQFQYTWSRTNNVDEVTENVVGAGFSHTF